MNTLYRILAETVFVLHIAVIALGTMAWKWWVDLHLLYSVIILIGGLSWLLTRRCILTDIENFLRIKAGQDPALVMQSFLGYHIAKLCGQRVFSDRYITGIVGLVYLVIVPFWLYTLYLFYL